MSSQSGAPLTRREQNFSVKRREKLRNELISRLGIDAFLPFSLMFIRKLTILILPFHILMNFLQLELHILMF